MHPISKLSRGSSAFTLTELMAVTGVIAILAGLLLSALSLAKTRAVEVQCSSNMKQLGLALAMYADENGGWLPEGRHEPSPASPSWIRRIQRQLGQTTRVAICPGDERAQERLRDQTTSYVMNEFTAVDRRDSAGHILETFRNLDRLKDQAGTMLLFVAAESPASSPTPDYARSRRWLEGWEAVLSDIDPGRHRFCGHGGDRPRGASNYLFADGHVQSIVAGRLKARIERGENFAKPPL